MSKALFKLPQTKHKSTIIIIEGTTGLRKSFFSIKYPLLNMSF